MKKIKTQKIKEQFQGKQFISEKQLEENKSSRGDNVSDGSFAAQKPLAQILADQKAKKEEEFQQQWKQMKQGKNRPLEDDEIEFLEKVRKESEQQQAKVAKEEKNELETFLKARNEMISQVVVSEEPPTKKRKINQSQQQTGFKLNTLVKKQSNVEEQGFNLFQDYGSDSNDDSNDE
eukprot:TRINITY_DN12293_c0_g1_i4.p1 TRINITY_DN12293_c0_g1~~TRINITY_DN12293_c0_g1_i4.p1  ORF type:complete len:177 (-),score=40.46 TRINITY_DN12293_c0_g1_i4:322-852(-)